MKFSSARQHVVVIYGLDVKHTSLIMTRTRNFCIYRRCNGSQKFEGKEGTFAFTSKARCHWYPGFRDPWAREEVSDVISTGSLLLSPLTSTGGLLLSPLLHQTGTSIYQYAIHKATNMRNKNFITNLKCLNGLMGWSNNFSSHNFPELLPAKSPHESIISSMLLQVPGDEKHSQDPIISYCKCKKQDNRKVKYSIQWSVKYNG